MKYFLFIALFSVIYWFNSAEAHLNKNMKVSYDICQNKVTHKFLNPQYTRIVNKQIKSDDYLSQFYVCKTVKLTKSQAQFISNFN